MARGEPARRNAAREPRSRSALPRSWPVVHDGPPGAAVYMQVIWQAMPLEQHMSAPGHAWPAPLAVTLRHAQR